MRRKTLHIVRRKGVAVRAEAFHLLQCEGSKSQLGEKRENGMRIAISAGGRDLDAPVDERFGRADCFLLVNPETLDFEALENKQNLQAAQGAGIQAAALLARSKVQAVLTGHCGPKAFKTLQAAGIPVVVGVKGTVREAVQRYARGELSYASAPDVEGHWG